jgi:hypothetical protein
MSAAISGRKFHRGAGCDLAVIFTVTTAITVATSAMMAESAEA